jgi:aconitate hydratase
VYSILSAHNSGDEKNLKIRFDSLTAHDITYVGIIQAAYSEVAPKRVAIGSAIYAHKPGDGSAREQAASCQRVLGASANLAREYATKRYRSNLINWGIIPFLAEDAMLFEQGDYFFLPGIRKAIAEQSGIKAYVINSGISEIRLSVGELTAVERRVLMDGCLINHYRGS